MALAYALHRLLLSRALSRDPMDVPLERNELGCPRVRGHDVCTSLSHADGLIALAVAEGPVGVDVEPAARAAVMTEIARQVYHYSEATGLFVLGETERNAALLAMWVRKEAVLKAAGVGLATPMQTFAAPEHASLRLPASLFGEAMQVRMLAADDRCVAAVAGPCGASIDCRWVRPALGAYAEEPSSCRDWTPIRSALP
ncbi:MAG: 4'-phosphopantetheinyl transferase family protein [Lysobacter sp.]